MAPLLLKLADHAYLVLRQDAGGDVVRVNAYFLGHGACGARVIAGEQVRGEPQLAQLRHCAGRVRLHCVPDRDHAFRAPVDLHGDRGGPGLLSLAERAGQWPIEFRAGPAHAHVVAFHGGGRPAARLIGKPGRFRDVVARGLDDRASDGVLGPGLYGGGEAQRVVAAGDVHDRHLAAGHGAGLVHHHRVHLAGGFQHLGALDQ